MGEITVLGPGELRPLRSARPPLRRTLDPRSGPQSSINGSIPTAYRSSCKLPRQKSAELHAFYKALWRTRTVDPRAVFPQRSLAWPSSGALAAAQNMKGLQISASPPTDSNRRPPPYNGGSGRDPGQRRALAITSSGADASQGTHSVALAHLLAHDDQNPCKLACSMWSRKPLSVVRRIEGSNPSPSAFPTDHGCRARRRRGASASPRQRIEPNRPHFTNGWRRGRVRSLLLRVRLRFRRRRGCGWGPLRFHPEPLRLVSFSPRPTQAGRCSSERCSGVDAAGPGRADWMLGRARSGRWLRGRPRGSQRPSVLLALRHLACL
jgi:hypothetical protein